MNKTQRVLQIIQTMRLVRPRDLEKLGISRKYLSRLYNKGQIERIDRGLYAPIDIDYVTEHHSLAQTAKLIPNGVVCLLSALQYHQLTTQLPHQVWLAIDYKARLPKSKRQMIRIVRFSGIALEYGIEKHNIEGVEVKIYNPAKTVADCFKYRNKIGLDVAIESLKDCLREKKATVDQLMEAAEVCRVANVIRPYMESLV